MPANRFGKTLNWFHSGCSRAFHFLLNFGGETVSKNVSHSRNGVLWERRGGGEGEEESTNFSNDISNGQLPAIREKKLSPKQTVKS